METSIPFSGFYESLWSAQLDDAETDIAQSLAGKVEGEHEDPEAEFYGFEASDIDEALFWCTDYAKVHKEIAQEYAECFADLLDSECGWPLRLKFDEMTSPREYNFTTDRIFMTLPRASVRRMKAECNDAPLRNIARERFTSRDGFISFYSPDVDTWGSVDSWDANQVGTLLLAWMASREIEDIEDDIFERMGCNGEFDSAVWHAIDMDALRKRLTAQERVV